VANAIALYHGFIRDAAARFGIPQQLLERQIMAESGGNPHARSGMGALGLMQLMPGTARGLGVENPLNPRENIMGGAKYLRDQFNKFGNWREALAAYNAGPAAVARYGGVPPFHETQSYVDEIMGHLPHVGAAPRETPPALAASAGMGERAPTHSRLPNFAGMAERFANEAVGAGPQTSDVMDQPQPDQPVMPDPGLSNPLTGWQQFLPRSRGKGGMLPRFDPNIVPIDTKKGGHAGGFLPQGASYKGGRLDQGHDFQTDPGGPIIAPGSGIVLRVAADPHGFGPAYPIVHFTSGPYKGHNIYIGHTVSRLQQGQRFKEGEILSLTGRHPVGNATVPGWAEIGYALRNGLPGHFGQKAPF
jgi:hypothetical protein